jgi:hypothetical protein
MTPTRTYTPTRTLSPTITNTRPNAYPYANRTDTHPDGDAAFVHSDGDAHAHTNQHHHTKQAR